MPTVPRLLRVVGWVAAMTVLANPVADRLGLKYRQSMEQLARVDAYLRRGEPADVVFLGASRTHADIVPAELEAALSAAGVEATVYDLGQPATSVVASAIVLRDLVRAGVAPPAMVVLAVSPGALNGNSAMLELTLERYGSLPDTLRGLLVPRLWRSALRGLLRGHGNLALAGYQWLAGTPAADSVRRLGARFGPEDAGQRCDSVADWTPEGRARSLTYLRTEHRRKTLREYQIGGLAVAALDEILAATSRSGAELVLLRYPVHPEYAVVYAHGEDHVFDTFIRGFAERHRLRYLDLSRTMTETDFIDHSHLNACGARRLSRRLGALLAAR